MAIEQDNGNGTLNHAWTGRLVHRHRRLLIVVVQMCLVAFANYGAFLLRFDGSIPPSWLETHRQTLPWLLAIRGLTFLPFGLYAGLWRYASIWDLRNIVLGVATSSLLFLGFIKSPLGPDVYPRSIHFMDALLLVCFLGGIRLVNRVYRELGRNGSAKTVLVYGAGDAGEMIVRDMRKNAAYGYEPIGFVDDDARKVGVKIHGVPVLGTRDKLPTILRHHKPQEVLIALPTAGPELIRQVVRTLEPYKIPIKILPNIQAILDGRVTVDHIRSLAVGDLLSRAPVDLDRGPIKSLIAGRRILVTGAGGSIGSELCRQIARYGPGALVLYDRYENGLHEIATELRDKGHGGSLHAVLGDITDVSRLDAVMREHQPAIIFHAAAHKHVPLMEQNPCEAVKNNVMGTRLVAEAAEQHGVDRFILISTDKAVNPTSVMGATKRVAEVLVRAQAAGSGTSFFTVRFGNVLASNGSVVPRFLDQIRAGGPVTVTHPDMRRYFMLIPEAVQLVLHAAAQGKTGEIYVLEMGEQVKVMDMARNLIRLAGLVPDEDIPISFIGVRPGEKLFEELVGRDEVTAPSGVENVLRVHQHHAPAAGTLVREVAHLERLALEGQTNQVLAQLQAIVPEFCSEMQATVADRPPVVRVPLAEPIPRQPRSAGQICPACRAPDVHRSRPHSALERVRRSMSARRLFRCHTCGWRGWLQSVDGLAYDAGAPPSAAPDLTLLDAALTPRPPTARPAFSPRQLR